MLVVDLLEIRDWLWSDNGVGVEGPEFVVIDVRLFIVRVPG